MSDKAIESYLQKRIGLDPSSIGSRTIGRVVQLRMQHCGLSGDYASYLRLLESSVAERDNLVEAVSVPETWFFRDRGVFAFLRKYSVDVWRPNHPGELLRVLSVPCSSGEEPYSIAMSLLDAGFSPGSFEIEAVDIRQSALDQAKAGFYQRNSFRGADLEFRDRYFVQNGDRYQLSQEVRERIHFRRANLLELSPSSDRLFDLIFCRNLLIYFGNEARTAAIDKFDRLLRPDGLLLVGHAETVWVSQYRFSMVDAPGAFALKKSSSTSLAAGPPVVGQKTGRRTAVGAKKAPAPARAAVSAPPAVAAVPASLEGARRLADQGRLDEAADQVGKFVAQAGPSAESCFLLGVISQAGGREDDALAFFNKSLYLDPGNEEALACLILLKEMTGDHPGAALLRERMGRLRKRQEGERR